MGRRVTILPAFLQLILQVDIVGLKFGAAFDIQMRRQCRVRRNQLRTDLILSLRHAGPIDSHREVPSERLTGRLVGIRSPLEVLGAGRIYGTANLGGGCAWAAYPSSGLPAFKVRAYDLPDSYGDLRSVYPFGHAALRSIG